MLHGGAKIVDLNGSEVTSAFLDRMGKRFGNVDDSGHE